MPLQSYTLSPYRPKAIVSQTCSAATMRACKVAAEHEDFVQLQIRYAT